MRDKATVDRQENGKSDKGIFVLFSPRYQGMLTVLGGMIAFLVILVHFWSIAYLSGYLSKLGYSLSIIEPGSVEREFIRGMIAMEGALFTAAVLVILPISTLVIGWLILRVFGGALVRILRRFKIPSASRRKPIRWLRFCVRYIVGCYFFKGKDRKGLVKVSAKLFAASSCGSILFVSIIWIVVGASYYGNRGSEKALSELKELHEIYSSGELSVGYSRFLCFKDNIGSDSHESSYKVYAPLICGRESCVVFDGISDLHLEKKSNLSGSITSYVSKIRLKEWSENQIDSEEYISNYIKKRERLAPIGEEGIKAEGLREQAILSLEREKLSKFSDFLCEKRFSAT